MLRGNFYICNFSVDWTKVPKENLTIARGQAMLGNACKTDNTGNSWNLENSPKKTVQTMQTTLKIQILINLGSFAFFVMFYTEVFKFTANFLCNLKFEIWRKSLMQRKFFDAWFLHRSGALPSLFDEWWWWGCVGYDDLD